MKIILRDDIEKLGEAGEVVTVKDGYARNYLIPHGYAYPATKSNLKVWENEKQSRLVRIAKETAEAEKIKAGLETVSLVIPMQVGEEGRLFGSVTNRMLADAFAEKGFDVDHRRIVIEEAIRTQGDFTIKVRLEHGVSATISVKVVSETGEEAPAPTEEPVAAEPAEPEVEAAEGGEAKVEDNA